MGLHVIKQPAEMLNGIIISSQRDDQSPSLPVSFRKPLPLRLSTRRKRLLDIMSPLHWTFRETFFQRFRNFYHNAFLILNWNCLKTVTKWPFMFTHQFSCFNCVIDHYYTKYVFFYLLRLFSYICLGTSIKIINKDNKTTMFIIKLWIEYSLWVHM